MPDILDGGDGRDNLAGGDGPDELHGGAGDDQFELGVAVPDGTDVVRGGAGAFDLAHYARPIGVTVTLGAGANDGEPGENDDVDTEEVRGGPSDDVLTGHPGAVANTLNGGSGGDDLLVGGDGPDSFFNGQVDEGSAPNGADRMQTGIDLVDYSGRSAPVTVTIGTSGRTTARRARATASWPPTRSAGAAPAIR